MARKVKLTGIGVDAEHTLTIITNARRASSLTDCPYRRGTHKWSIWKTAFHHKRASHREIAKALLQAGVKCNERVDTSGHPTG